MLAKLNEVELRSGETMSVFLMRPPETETAARLEKLYFHKSAVWKNDILRRLHARTDGLTVDSYFFGEVGNEIAGSIWTTVPADTRDVGTLGHVFTAERHRKKGVCDFILAESIRRFEFEGGLGLHLATGGAVAMRIYEGQGFKRICGGIFRKGPDSFQPFEEKYFAKDEGVSIRDLRIDDLPRLEALFNSTGLWLVLDETLGCYQGTGFEGQFLTILDLVEKKTGLCRVLENSTKRVVGIARLTPSAPDLRAHIGRLEFFIHANYLSDGKTLIESILKNDESGKYRQIRAVCGSRDSERAGILLQSGFEKTAILPDELQRDGLFEDAVFYSKKIR